MSLNADTKIIHFIDSLFTPVSSSSAKFTNVKSSYAKKAGTHTSDATFTPPFKYKSVFDYGVSIPLLIYLLGYYTQSILEM